MENRTSHKHYLRCASFILMIALSVLSCDDEEEPKKDDQDPEIVGTWVLTEAKLGECTNNSYNSTFPMICTAQECTTLKFSADNTLQSVVKDPNNVDNPVRTSNGTYSIAGNKVTMCLTENGSQNCEDRTFTLAAQNLTLVRPATTVSDPTCKETTLFTKQ